MDAQVTGFDEWMCMPAIGTCLAEPFSPGDPPPGPPMLARSTPCLPSPRLRIRKGDYLVDYEEKVFEDVKAKPGEKALITFHTVAFEGSIGLVNILQALRLQRKGFKTTVLLYGPGVTLGVQRGFPKLGDEPFPGAQNFGNQIDQVHGRRRRDLLLPFRAADALRPRRRRR